MILMMKMVFAIIWKIQKCLLNKKEQNMLWASVLIYIEDALNDSSYIDYIL